MEKNKKKKGEFRLREIMDLKKLNKIIKFVSIIGFIVNIIIATSLFVFCTTNSIKLFKLSNETLVKDEGVVEFISKINGYSNEETTNLVIDYGKGELFTFEVLLPSISKIIIILLIAFLFKKIYDFVEDVNDEKSLFTQNKLNKLKEIRADGIFILIFFLIDYDFDGFISVIIIVILAEVIMYLFDQCVKNYKEIEEK